jgi:hypothetical protein
MSKSYFAVVSFGRNPLKGRFFRTADAAQRALRREADHTFLSANGRIYSYATAGEARAACISDKQG